MPVAKPPACTAARLLEEGRSSTYDVNFILILVKVNNNLIIILNNVNIILILVNVNNNVINVIIILNNANIILIAIITSYANMDHYVQGWQPCGKVEGPVQ